MKQNMAAQRNVGTEPRPRRSMAAAIPAVLLGVSSQNNLPGKTDQGILIAAWGSIIRLTLSLPGALFPA